MIYMKKEKNIAFLVKEARKNKGYSARELAKLCSVSHTEINNIEKGIRVKPGILTLKAFEKYLDLDYKELATLVGYSEETVQYGDEDIIVSFERYDRKVNEFQEVKKHLLYDIDRRRHIGMDIKEEFDNITNYINKNKISDKDLEKNITNINKLLDNLTEKFDDFWLKDYK